MNEEDESHLFGFVKPYYQVVVNYRSTEHSERGHLDVQLRYEKDNGRTYTTVLRAHEFPTTGKFGFDPSGSIHFPKDSWVSEAGVPKAAVMEFFICLFELDYSDKVDEDGCYEYKGEKHYVGT